MDKITRTGIFVSPETHYQLKKMAVDKKMTFDELINYLVLMEEQNKK